MTRLFTFAIATLLALPAAATELGDDGLHKADWMRDTFKDLQEDAAEAADEGTRVVLLIEQRGCVYCRDMHEKTFVDPRIEALLTDDYFPIQLNLHGDTEVIDFDVTRGISTDI